MNRNSYETFVKQQDVTQANFPGDSRQKKSSVKEKISSGYSSSTSLSTPNLPKVSERPVLSSRNKDYNSEPTLSDKTVPCSRPKQFMDDIPKKLYSSCQRNEKRRNHLHQKVYRNACIQLGCMVTFFVILVLVDEKVAIMFAVFLIVFVILFVVSVPSKCRVKTT